jgi:ABC-type phosphate transport system substrate-binding protein
MTRSVHLPRARALLAVSLLLAGLLLALGAQRSDAAFSTAKCQGADITGRGASFAATAQSAWKLNFQGLYCAGSTFPNVTYEATGSGAGLESMGARRGANSTGANSRNQVPRFAGTDDPPTPTQVAQINQGTDAVGDEGLIHVVPAAVGAVAPLVNFPNDCDVSLLPAAERTPAQDLNTNAVDDDVVRVRFTKAKWEAAWTGQSDSDNWTELFPELAADSDCDKPIIRVVRFDASGTTFAFKDYLDSIDPVQGWTTTYQSGNATAGNREWPNATFGTRSDCSGSPSGPGSQDDATDHLTSGCSNGASALVAKLSGTDGSIGYADIATARNASPSLAITPEANDNDTYWTQIQNGSNAFTEPTADPNGFRSDGPKGANCLLTAFSEVPTSTFGDWAQTSGVNANAGYGICTLTYGLLFDDNADAWGNTSEEEAKAASVKDYWTSIVSDAGQALLFSNDYAPLSPGLLAIARAGVTSIDWNKTGGGGNPGGGDPGGGNPGGGGPGGSTPPPSKPSNAFSVPATAISSRTGNATFSIRLPGAGQVTLKATAGAGRKKITVGSLRQSVSKAGTVKLTLKPAGKAKQRLKKSGKLVVKVTITFTPQGGDARTSTRTVTLKLKRKVGKARR